MSRFSDEIILSHSTKKLPKGTLLCFTEFLVSKNFVDRRGEYYDFLAKILSQGAEKFCRGSLLCFRKFLLSENVRDKRGGGYHDFTSKMFYLTVPNHFLEEPFCAVFQEISASKKVYG